MNDFTLERVYKQPTSYDFLGSYFFKPIMIGDIEISIQASKYHYCEPTEDLESSDAYQSFEVAMMNSQGFLNPILHDKFKHKSWAQYWSNSDEVGYKVPRSEIIKMFQDLKAQFN